MSSTIQVRVDDDLKIKSDNLFKELGTDTTTAIRMFLTQAVANNGFPFEIKKVAANPYIAISEKEVLDRLAKSRDQSKNGEYSEAAWKTMQINGDIYGIPAYSNEGNGLYYVLNNNILDKYHLDISDITEDLKS